MTEPADLGRWPRWPVRAAWMERRDLLGIIALGVLLRVMWLPLGNGDSRFLNVDSQAYRTFAGGLPEALGSPSGTLLDVSLQRSPGYPGLVALLGAAGDGSLIPLLVVQSVIGGAVTVLLTFAIARRVVGERAALVAAGLVAVDPVSIAHSLQVGTETLVTALLAGAALCAWLARERAAADGPTTGALVGCGVLLGVSGLVRPQIVYLSLATALAVGAWVGVCRSELRRQQVRTAVAAFAVVAISVALVGGPWLVRNRVVTGRWVVSTAEGQNLADMGAASMEAEASGVAWWTEETEKSYRRHDRARQRFEARYGRAVEDPDVVARDAAWARSGRDAIREHPRGALMVAAAAVTRTVAGPSDTLLAAHLDHPPVAVTRALRGTALSVLVVQLGLAAVGAISLARGRSWAAMAALVGPVMGYLLSSAGPQMYARFRVPIVPYLAVLAACGLACLWPNRWGLSAEP